MKIIFLDIDGVLNTEKGLIHHFTVGDEHNNTHDKYGPKFCPIAVENLKRLIEESGDDIRIVITSTWRADGLVWLKELWRERDLPGFIYDVTVLSSCVSKSGVRIPRGSEIEKYLNEEGFWSYQEILGEEQSCNTVESFVILDDDSDMLYNQKNHFVHLDPFVGFSDKRKLNRAIRILNNGSNSF